VPEIVSGEQRQNVATLVILRLGKKDNFAKQKRMRLRGMSWMIALLGVTHSVGAQLTAADVQKVINQAVTRAVSISGSSVIAVTDREGYVLGVWNVRGGEPTDEQVATAVSKAGTAAFLSSNQNAFTSRTAGFIIQQHFPPGVQNAAPGPLVGVGLSNLFFSDINKFKGPGTVPLFSPTPGKGIAFVLFTSLDGTPGGVPLYKNGALVGGVGVTGDGVPAPIADFRDENPFVFVPGYDKDEDVALAGQSGFRPSSSITADNVYINGFALSYVNSSTSNSGTVVLHGNASSKYPIIASPPPFPYPITTFGGIQGETRQPIINDPLPGTINGQSRLTATEVRGIINLAADRARTTRAGIRLPIGAQMQVFITVVNNPNQVGVGPTVLGTFRTGEATMFSWDVAVQKARTSIYYSTRDLLGFGRNIAMSTRSVGFLAQKNYPPGIDADLPGPFFPDQAMFTCLTVPDLTLKPGCIPPAEPTLPNGITIFPGGFPLYRNGVLVGAIGISGDGVDQDDIVGASGTRDFLAPDAIRADQFVFKDARLPYAKFPRDPTGTNGKVEVVTAAPILGAPRLANVSTRASIGTGSNQLIAGFTVVGSDPKQLLIRALGPSLTGFGVPGALSDPTLTLHNSAGANLAFNDDWNLAANSGQIPPQLRPTDSREAAILTTLPAGSYTAIEAGKGGTSGIGLIEGYDLDSTTAAQLGSVSSRAHVQAGSGVLIGGLIITAQNGGLPVLLRALGPSLAAFGIANPLNDPVLEIRNVSGTVVGTNDNWTQTQQAAIEATGLAPPSDKDAAILANLAPGLYTVIVRDATSGSGVGLFEAYNLRLPPPLNFR
jgi:uncharacterized protein GlcG (DUF336 family)